MKKISMAGIALGLLFPLTAAAAAIPLTQEELLEQSDTVIDARLIGAEARRFGDVLVTLVELRVEARLEGRLREGATATVVVLGGVDPATGEGVAVCRGPRVEPGTVARFFLREARGVIEGIDYSFLEGVPGALFVEVGPSRRSGQGGAR